MHLRKTALFVYRTEIHFEHPMYLKGTFFVIYNFICAKKQRQTNDEDRPTVFTKFVRFKIICIRLL